MGSADETWKSGVVSPAGNGPASGGSTTPPPKGVLPTGMKDEQRRLAGAALHFGVGFGVLVPFIELTSPGREAPSLGRLGAEVATFAFAVTLVVAARARNDLRHRHIAALGQALLVVGAVGIAFVEQWRPLPGDLAWPGVPWVGAWLLIFPFVGPSVVGGARAGTVVAALSVPAVAGLAVATGVRELPTAIGWAGVIGPTFAAAGLHLLPAMAILDLAEARTGPYRLLRPIGHGGMGEVWLASHKLLARPAAVKLIQRAAGTSSGDRTGREGEVRRFHREATATARLQSPHTVRLFDFGVAADGRFFYVMEFLEGVDLDQLVRRFGAVPPERAVALVAQACLSLAEAHQHGLVHRDVKPSNLFTCRAGLEVDFVKVLDFGLVAVGRRAPRGAAEGHLHTQFRGIVGTPSYVAPEVLRGVLDDPRSDVYALGCVLFWLVAGRPVFTGPDVDAILDAHLGDDPLPPSYASGFEVPSAFDDLVLACLAKDPANRPQDMTVLRERLLAIEFGDPWSESRAARWWTQHLPPTT